MKRLILVFIVSLTFFNANATHIMGGEITWQCIKDPLDPDLGKYIFTMKLYRDCEGTTLPTGSEFVNMWGAGAPVTSITCDFISNTDISPVGNSINSGNPCLVCQPGASNGDVGAVEEYVYQSQPISLVGTPPASGWHFTWASCCRNAAIVNLVSPDNQGFTLRAAMYPYTDPGTGLVFPADPCFDSSPVFNESPKTIICAGYPFGYSHNASDPELDSIRYYWAEPLDDFFGTFDPDPVNNSPGLLAFIPPYAFNSPIPGNVNMNPISGEISYATTVLQAGSFATVTRVEAFKCGQKVAEIHRDIQAVLIACPSMPGGGTNNPPILTAPVGSQTWITTISPTGLPTYSATVTAGELITFNVTASDSDLYNGITPQDLTMEISGGQMLDPLSGTCSNPPCATFTDLGGNPPPIISPTISEGIFEWQTSCYHVSSDIACGRTTNLYQFSIKAFDDFCPAPAIRISTLLIYVEADNSLQVSEQSPTCFGNDGVISIVPSLSISQINWDAELFDLSGLLIYSSTNINDTSYSFQNVSEGSYIVRASGAGGCIIEDTVILVQVPNPLYIDTRVSHVSCYGGSDGEIGVLLDNGLLPYTFYIDGVENLDPPPYDSLFADLSEGTYIITGIDSDSCQIIDTVEIMSPQFPLQILSSNSVTICDSSAEGSALAYAAGGSPYSDGSYIFEWFDDSWGSLGIGESVSGLTIGNYYLEVTDSNGCDIFTSINVSTPQLPLTISPELYNVSCTGDSTGIAIASASGGFAPYDYNWMYLNGSSIYTSSAPPFADTVVLAAGSYHLIVEDAAGCTKDIVFDITESSSRLAIDAVLAVDSIDCYGDSDGRAVVQMILGSGTPTYSYLWDNGEDSVVANSLTGGWHTVEVIDTRGCLVIDSVNIPENSLIVSVFSIIDSVSCYGESDGKIQVSTYGGVQLFTSPFYDYFWSTGADSTVNNIDNLSHGSYYLITRDALGCVVVDSIYLSEPDPLYVNAQEILRVSCYGDSTGQSFAYGVGGTVPYTFTWVLNSIVDASGTDSSIVNTLYSAVETVILEDARGCIAQDTVMIHQPDALEVSIIDSVYAYCVGVNTVELTAGVFGGTYPYTYEWDDVLFAPQTTVTASNLEAGTYTVVVTDMRGCQDSVTVNMDSVSSTMEVLISVGNTVSCYGSNDGALVALASSGQGPYTYQWVGPSGTNTNDTNINLLPGNYSVTATDVNGCVVNTYEQLIEPSPLLYKVLSLMPSTCLGSCDGEVELYIQGGVGPYMALFTENITSQSTLFNVNDSSIINSVCTGDYTVSVQDANSCDAVLIGGASNQAVLNTTITTDVDLDVQAQVNVLCNGTATGVLQVLNPNINPDYTYSWQNASGNIIGEDNSIDSLLAGTYVLSANYLNFSGCTTTDTVTITEITIIHSSSMIEDVDCNGNSTGVINTTTLGGTSPYSYSWTPPQLNNDTIENLAEGIYVLSITDVNNCQQTQTYTVTEPLALQLTIDSVQTYILTSVISGGTSPYSYSWRKQPQASNEIGIGSTYVVGSYGTYYVIVTDANGCEIASNTITYEEIVLGVLDAVDININIYPNPFKKQTTVDFGRVVKKATINVTDVYGKQVEAYIVSNANKHILKRNNKASGIYFVEIEVGEQEKVIFKLIVQ